MFRYIVWLSILVASSSVAVHSATIVKPSIEQAQEHVQELSRLLGNIKDAAQPQHCTDLLHAGQTNSGVYRVFHKAAGSLGQNVYCDMATDGGGWTVIQRRGQFGNSVYHFYRNWTQYASGFGDPVEEYWIGNNALHALTSSEQQMALRVVLRNNTEDSVFMDYESMSVGDEESLYKLQVGQFFGPEGFSTGSCARQSRVVIADHHDAVANAAHRRHFKQTSTQRRSLDDTGCNVTSTGIPKKYTRQLLAKQLTRL